MAANKITVFFLFYAKFSSAEELCTYVGWIDGWMDEIENNVSLVAYH